jgi:hypothetical protein
MTEGRKHFGELGLWRAGNLIHAHTGRCLLCENEGGDTIVFAKVAPTGDGRLAVVPVTNASALCPACRAKHLPMSRPMRRKLDGLSKKVWRRLMKPDECPCCCGIEWHPGHPGVEIAGKPAGVVEH